MNLLVKVPPVRTIPLAIGRLEVAMATYEELDSVWSELEEQLAQRGCLVFPAEIDSGRRTSRLLA